MLSQIDWQPLPHSAQQLLTSLDLVEQRSDGLIRTQETTDMRCGFGHVSTLNLFNHDVQTWPSTDGAVMPLG